METITLLGTLMGFGFVCGIRLYSTVLTVGLCIHFGLIQLDPNLASLSILDNKYILTVAGIFYVAEFIADKIPWVDNFWDAIHTVIRPVGAAALAATALGPVDPVIKIIAVLVCGGVAFSSHAPKGLTRLLANGHHLYLFGITFFISLFEDFFAIIAAWMSLAHPLVMLGVVLVFLALAPWLTLKLLRLIKHLGTSVFQRVASIYRWITGAPQVKDGVADRLQKLKVLHDQGVINDDEHQKKRAEILQEM